MSQHTTKAVRATIQLGGIGIEVFQLPDGSYQLSQAQVAEAIGQHPNYISRFLGKNDVKAILSKRLANHRIKVEGSKKPVNIVPLEIVTAFWLNEAIGGNSLAAALTSACLIETLERRADAAFGVKRSEEEREEQLKARMHGKRIRRSFTDAIADYLDRHPELSEDCREWIYINSSEAVNRVVFNKRAWELRNERGADRHSLRDFFTAEELLLIQEVEDVATRLVDHEDAHPPRAVRLAGDRLLLNHRNQSRVQDSQPRNVLTSAGRRR